MAPSEIGLIPLFAPHHCELTSRLMFIVRCPHLTKKTAGSQKVYKLAVLEALLELSGAGHLMNTTLLETLLVRFGCGK